MRLIQAHIQADPLAAARRRLDLARWRTARRRGSHAVVLITHASGGGVERQIAASVERHRADGDRAIVLRPSRSPDGARCVTVGDGTADAFPNLRYVMPDELAELLRLLRRERPRVIELHHLVGHHPTVIDLLGGLDVPYDIHVHDYAWLCGRVALVGPAQRYCGEPAVAQCEACVADAGNLIEEDITVAALRRRSAKLLAGARRVVVPSEDAAARIRRHFPAARPVVQPHERRCGDSATRRPRPRRKSAASAWLARSASTRVTRWCSTARAMPRNGACRWNSSWSATRSTIADCSPRGGSSSPAATRPTRL